MCWNYLSFLTKPSILNLFTITPPPPPPPPQSQTIQQSHSGHPSSNTSNTKQPPLPPMSAFEKPMTPSQVPTGMGLALPMLHDHLLTLGYLSVKPLGSNDEVVLSILDNKHPANVSICTDCNSLKCFICLTVLLAGDEISFPGYLFIERIVCPCRWTKFWELMLLLWLRFLFVYFDTCFGTQYVEDHLWLVDAHGFFWCYIDSGQYQAQVSWAHLHHIIQSAGLNGSILM